MIQRTMEGLKRARESGKHLGRPYGLRYRKLAADIKQVKKLANKGFNKAELARYFKCHWQTMHRFMRENNIESGVR